MIRRTGVIVLCGSILAGCSTGAVYLKHRGSGETAKCGPYFEPNPIIVQMSICCGAQKRLRQCVDDFKAQGYERLSDDYEPPRKD